MPLLNLIPSLKFVTIPIDSKTITTPNSFCALKVSCKKSREAAIVMRDLTADRIVTSDDSSSCNALK